MGKRRNGKVMTPNRIATFATLGAMAVAAGMAWNAVAENAKQGNARSKTNEAVVRDFLTAAQLRVQAQEFEKKKARRERKETRERVDGYHPPRSEMP